ncbi:hypothetical protein, partial [Leucobacter sp. M11]
RHSWRASAEELLRCYAALDTRATPAPPGRGEPDTAATGRK